MAYSIHDLVTVRHSDGRTEVVVCDESLKIVLDGLDRMDLTLPITGEDQWCIVEEYLEDLDVEIGQVEAEGIYPTREYSDRVCRACDEFCLGYEFDFIDHNDVNRRLAKLLEDLGEGGRYSLGYERWLPKKDMGSPGKRK